MKTSIDKLPNIITEFVDNKLIPSSPGSMKWVLGGITYLVLNREQEILNKYLPTLTMLGLVEDNLIDTIEFYIEKLLPLYNLTKWYIKS